MNPNSVENKRGAAAASPQRRTGAAEHTVKAVKELWPTAK
jgi:hypothetical protein